MKEVTSKVRHKGKEVDSVTICEYETIEELIEGEKKEHILNMFNKQNKIRIQANARAKHSEGRGGKNKRKEVAFNLLTTEDMARFAGKWDELQQFLTSPEMSVRVDAEMGVGDGSEDEVATEE